MLKGLRTLFAGSKALERHIALFSICGIVGIFQGWIACGAQDILVVSNIQKLVFISLLSVFTFFMTGYEIIFMHDRELPEIDMKSFKIVFNKIPFLVFFITFILFIAGFYKDFTVSLEIFLAVPLTMLLAGFSYNFSDFEAVRFLKKINIKDYLILSLKGLFILALAFFISFGIIFIIFFIYGIVIAVLFKGNLTSIGMFISSNQLIINKLSNFVLAIILTYLLTLGTLVWNLELLKTFEQKD